MAFAGAIYKNEIADKMPRIDTKGIMLCFSTCFVVYFIFLYESIQPHAIAYSASVPTEMPSF